MRIAVEYLLGRVYAATGPRSTDPEWPPHPARLFSSLVAAAKETAMGAEADEALRWLEGLSSPEIACGRLLPSRSFPRFVPVNWIRKKNQKQVRELAEHYSAVAPISEPLVSFIWPEVTGWPRTLHDIAARVSRLGASASFVRVWVDHEQPASVWKPGASGDFLGVPYPGRLDDLEEAFSRNEPPPAPRTAPYARGPNPGVSGEWDEMLIFRRVDGPRVDAAFVLQVSEALRNALLRSAGELDLLVPEIHGHAPDGGPYKGAHCGFAALPNVGYTHSDGALLGAAVLLPRLDPAVRHKILAAAGGVHILRFAGLEWQVEECGVTDRRALQPLSWMEPSRAWSSAIPIQLPVWKDAPQVIRNSCLKLGLPEPDVQVAMQQGLEGSPSPHELSRCRRTGRRALTVHARLRFPVRVRGPLLLGVHRHFGLGLLKPMDEEVG